MNGTAIVELHVRYHTEGRCQVCQMRTICRDQQHFHCYITEILGTLSTTLTTSKDLWQCLNFSTIRR